MTYMEENDLSRKENILKVTLDIIKEEGFEGVTIRKIASRAKVNIALINYHFGSKDNLISEALKILINVFKDAFISLDDTTLPPRKRLENFIINYTKIAIQYPEIVKRVFLQNSFNFESQNEFLHFLKTTGFIKIHHTLHEITGKTDNSELMAMMIQMMGSIIFPIIMFPELKKASGIDPSSPGAFENYIKLLIENYFSQYNNT